MSYATVNQLEAGWRILDDAEKPRAEVLLRMASTWLDAQTGMRFAGRELTEHEELLLQDIACNVVRRAIGEASPVNTEVEWAQVTTPYDQTFTPAKTLGDFYLTKWEKKALGVSGYVYASAMC